jgi:Fe2+ transport system protein FeoA
MQSSSDFPLMRCAPGEKVRVKRVRDGNAAVLKRASRLGINLGRTMEVIGRRSINGPLKVRIGRRQRVVRSDIAAAIFVEPW